MEEEEETSWGQDGEAAKDISRPKELQKAQQK
jgi:hypothetical protein